MPFDPLLQVAFVKVFQAVMQAHDQLAYLIRTKHCPDSKQRPVLLFHARMGTSICARARPEDYQPGTLYHCRAHPRALRVSQIVHSKHQEVFSVRETHRHPGTGGADQNVRWSEFAADIAAGMRHLTTEERRKRAAFQRCSVVRIRPVYPGSSAHREPRMSNDHSKEGLR